MSENHALPPEVASFPMLPLRDVVVFPHMVIPLFVGRPKSIRALEAAMEGGRHILLVAQKNAQKDEPAMADIYPVGTVATVLQLLKLPDGTVKVLVEGLQRADMLSLKDEDGYFSAEALPHEPADDEAMSRSHASRLAVAV